MTCKGCRTPNLLSERGVTITKCIIQNNAPKRDCPCRTCIVKPICISQCKEFESLVDSIFKFGLSYDYKYVSNTLYGGTLVNPHYKRIY